MKIWDISPLISEKTAVFPGDVPFSREISMDTKNGQHLTLSSIKTTVHIGAHADAGNHYHRDGKGVEARPLENYLGPCEVIEVKLARGARIGIAHLNGRLPLAPRILFKTNSFPDPNLWNNDFNSLSPELIEFLADCGVVLVGIDTPSVDPVDSKALESHQALHRHNLAVLEGLVLDKVTEGTYLLIALPLALKDADASPVRAVLIDELR
ncbi:MAG: cyclase family protein [Bdellovibrionota bacterium]